MENSRLSVPGLKRARYEDNLHADLSCLSEINFLYGDLIFDTTTG